MSTPRDDYDSPWKEIIETFFPQFLLFYFPEIASEVDWHRPHEFLDKELQQVVREAEVGRHTVDKLVKVKLLTGNELWLLIHIEVQSQVDATFAKRIFVSNYRLFDRYGIEVISLGVLADGQADWRPSVYGYGRFGSEMRLIFPVVKLLDFEAKWEQLEQSRNPFAVVTMAHLKALRTKRKGRERLQWKINLVKDLYGRGYRRKEIYELFRFIDWVLVLKPEMEQIFREELYQLEEAEKMRYVTSIERLALQEGLEQGLEQGREEGHEAGREEGLEQGKLRSAREFVIEALTLRFQTIPQELIDDINALKELQQLRKLLRLAIMVGSIEEFEREETFVTNAAADADLPA